MSIFLCVFSIKEKTPSRSFLWWFKFSLVAYVIPSIAYTLSVLWEGYRISVSLQSFIPLVVVWRLGISLSEKRCAAIILTMIGTGVIWTSLSWQHGLWVVWSSLLASALQIFSTAEFFYILILNKTRQHLLSIILLCQNPSQNSIHAFFLTKFYEFFFMNWGCHMSISGSRPSQKLSPRLNVLTICGDDFPEASGA